LEYVDETEAATSRLAAMGSRRNENVEPVYAALCFKSSAAGSAETGLIAAERVSNGLGAVLEIEEIDQVGKFYLKTL